MRLVGVAAALLWACAASATTVPGNLVLTSSTVSGVATYTNLARSTPLTFLSAAGTMTINGISTTGAQDGEVLYLQRNEAGQTTILANNAVDGNARLLLGSLDTNVIGRFGAQLIYLSGNWYLLGYTREQT